MNSNDFYKLKYLKYKNKYVNYKKNILEQKGGTLIIWMFYISIPDVYKLTSINEFGRGAPFKKCIDSWSVIIDSKNITTIEDYKKYSFMYSNSTKNGKVQNGKVQIRKMCKTAAEQSKEKYKQIDIDKLAETNLKKEYTIEELLIEHKKLSATGQSAQLDETEKKLLEGTITVKVEEYKNFFGKSTTSILWIINKDDKQLPINEGDPECQPEKK